jgi:hypothetical protein
MKQLLVALLVLAALGCMQKPVPVAELSTIDPAERPAIDVLYVGVPTMLVFAQPAADAPQIGNYGLTEAISVLERKGEWSMIRTFSGTGWVKSSDLLRGAALEKITADAMPRFYVAPQAVPFNTRGEIILQAKVNTDGAVIDVTTIKNTTGSTALADSNASALKVATFYPLVDKGTRKTFVYEHHVYY